MSGKRGSSKPVVAYGSLYLDRGERMKVVKDQIKVLARESPNSPFFFDVIYGPGQEALATEYAERVRRFADRFTFTEISVGTSFAETPQADPRHSKQGTE
jgi:ATP-dependent DNA ligase